MNLFNCKCDSRNVCLYCQQDIIETEIEEAVLGLDRNSHTVYKNTTYPNVFSQEMYCRKLGSVL
mgnify:FL=1